jgi:uncharacterized protein (DUF362 family)
LSNVAIVKGSNPVEMVVEALDLIGAEKAFNSEERILVKPNYINASHPSTGNTTDARVIEGTVKFLKERGLGNVAIGEGSGLSNTMRAYKVAGVDEVAKRWGVDLIDLDDDEYVMVDVPDCLALKSVRISKTALETAIVSVPKLKLHRMAGVTLSLKNLMGVVSPKGQIHHNLHEKIADLASVVRPRLAVIDGIVGGGGHELAGRPIKMDLVIAGLDPVAVDTVGAAVMGFDPKKAKHIALAAQKGLGTCDLEKIKIVGEPIDKVKKDFRRYF